MVAITPDGRYSISTSFDRTIRVWNIEIGKQQHILKGHTNRVWAVAATPDSERIISASFDHTLKVWDISNGKIKTGFSGDNPFMTCAVSLDGRTIVAGDKSGCVHILRLEGAD